MATISLEKGRGLRLSLEGYRPSTVSPGGPHIWTSEYQNLIREWQPAALSRFLPRAVFDESDPSSVLFQYEVNGTEVCSRSRPLGTEKLPKREIKEFFESLNLLKERANSLNVDADKRSAIEALELPDPQFEPNCYRVHGPRWRRRICVLWGFQQRQGSGLRLVSADDAARTLHAKNSFRVWPYMLAALLLLLLLLVLLCKIFAFPICSYLADLAQSPFSTRGSSGRLLVEDVTSAGPNSSRSSREQSAPRSPSEGAPSLRGGSTSPSVGITTPSAQNADAPSRTPSVDPSAGRSAAGRPEVTEPAGQQAGGPSIGQSRGQNGGSGFGVPSGTPAVPPGSSAHGPTPLPSQGSSTAGDMGPQGQAFAPTSPGAGSQSISRGGAQGSASGTRASSVATATPVSPSGSNGAAQSTLPGSSAGEGSAGPQSDVTAPAAMGGANAPGSAAQVGAGDRTSLPTPIPRPRQGGNPSHTSNLDSASGLPTRGQSRAQSGQRGVNASAPGGDKQNSENASVAQNAAPGVGAAGRVSRSDGGRATANSPQPRPDRSGGAGDSSQAANTGPRLSDRAPNDVNRPSGSAPSNVRPEGQSAQANGQSGDNATTTDLRRPGSSPTPNGGTQQPTGPSNDGGALAQPGSSLPPLSVTPENSFRPEIISQTTTPDGKLTIVMRAVGKNSNTEAPRSIRWAISGATVVGSQVQFTLGPRDAPYQLEFVSDPNALADTYAVSVNARATLK